MFFSSKHSLGLPTDCKTGGVKFAGSTGAATAAWPFRGKLVDLWFGADPFNTGAPRDPAILKPRSNNHEEVNFHWSNLSFLQNTNTSKEDT